MAEHNEFYRDFSNRKPFNNIPCGTDEVLAPVVIDDDYRDYLKDLGLIWDNVEVWHFPGSKEGVRVAFIQVRACEKEQAMKYFNGQVNRFLNRHKKGKEADQISLDEIFEAVEDDKRSGMDPTGSTKAEDDAFTEMVIELLIADLGKYNPMYGQIFQLLLEGYKKKEILEQVDTGTAKSQGYDLIRKVREMAKEIYEEYYN